MRPLFRVYKCNRCEYIDYTIVENDDAINQCGLCGNKIDHNSTTVHVSTEGEAIYKTKMLIQSKSLKHPTPRPTHGLGTKKRILRMVAKLIELNKGKPVSLSEVLDECTHAGISQEKVLHFLNVLSKEGSIQNHANYLTTNMEAVA